VGCQRTDPVVTYTVPTKLPEQLKPAKDRMLAAMFPKGQDAWFIKVTGPEPAIAEVESEFRRFVETLPFENGKPKLMSLPENWQRAGDKPMRVASIDVDTAAKQLDISISKLPKRDDWDSFVADNVNRWRGQLGLPRSDAKWAEGTQIAIESADGAGVWVDLVGQPSSGSSMSPPFATGGAGPATPPDAPSRDPRESRLQYERPEGWRDGRTSSIRIAAFVVGADDEAEVTVIPAGGDLRENVARWLGQVRGGAAPEEVVDKAMSEAQSIEVNGLAAQRYWLTGEDADKGNAIDATIVPLGNGGSMFIKMTGPVATVSGQSEALTAFLESLKF
jgi:hypothetical protein